MMDEWRYRSEVDALRRQRARTIANLARTLAANCRLCTARLKKTGYIAPGGIPVTLTTCPRCDRKDDD